MYKIGLGRLSRHRRRDSSFPSPHFTRYKSRVWSLLRAWNCLSCGKYVFDYTVITSRYRIRYTIWALQKIFFPSRFIIIPLSRHCLNSCFNHTDEISPSINRNYDLRNVNPREIFERVRLRVSCVDVNRCLLLNHTFPCHLTHLGAITRWVSRSRARRRITQLESSAQTLYILGRFQRFDRISRYWSFSMFSGHVFGGSRDRDTGKLEPGRFLVPVGLQPCSWLSTTQHHHSRHRHRRRDKVQGRPARHQIRILVVL